LLSLAFRWESLQRWDLGHNLLLSPAFQWESLQRWDLSFHTAISYHGAPSRSFLSHNGTSAITEPFMNFFFYAMELWLSRILSQTFSYTMEFWLSRSLSRTYSFTRWNSGYHGAFHELFLFTRWNSGYHRAFHELLLSHDGILAITEPFMNFFIWLSPRDT
jgi:hypothetical protein